MKNTAKRLFTMVLLLCMLLTYIVPMTYLEAQAATAPTVYNFNQHSQYGALPVDPVSGKASPFYHALIGNLGSSQCQESIPQRYANGTLNWTYEAASAAICGTTTDTEHLPNYDSRLIKKGLRSVIGEGNWIAFRIKSPGAGTYSMDLNYYAMGGDPTVAVYILEAEGEASIDQDVVLQRREAIGKAMDPDNRVGMADLYVETTEGDHSTFIGNWTFGDAQEYILVVENYQNAPIAGSYTYLENIVFTPGATDRKPLTGESTPHSVTVLKNAVAASDGGHMGALWVENGHDYFYLPIEGGKMAIYDLDQWKLVKTVTSGLNYPTSATVTQDGKVVIGGDGKKIYIYDTKTGIGYNTADFRKTPGLENEGHNSGVHAGADGHIYFGTLYGGHMVQYNIATKTYKDLGDMVCKEIQQMAIPGLKDGQVENNGDVAACYYHNGFVYGWAVSDSYSIVVKYDLQQGNVVGAINASDWLYDGRLQGMSVLGDKYLIVGCAGAEGMTLIDLSTFTLVSYAQAISTGLISGNTAKLEALWESGMSGHASEVIDGKQYFVATCGFYAYDIAANKITYIGSGNTGFRTGSRTAVTLDRDGDGVEELYLMSYGGTPVNPRLYNPAEGKKIGTSGLVQTQYEEGGGSTINIGDSHDGVLYIGAWNNWNCVAFDTKTEKVLSRYVTGGQTDSQVSYVDEQGNFHLVSGNYSACVVYEIDPLNKTGYGGDEESNIIMPLIANMKKYQQKRIHTVEGGDGYVFAGTIPDSYRNGGGVGIYNRETGKEDFIRFKEKPTNGEKVVSNPELWDLAVKTLVYSDGLLYGATTRAGGSGSSMVEGTSAQIFVMDYENMEIEATLDLRDYLTLVDADKDGVEDPIDHIGSISADPVVEGRIWGTVSDILFYFTYDEATKTFHVQEVLHLNHNEYELSGGATIKSRRIQFDLEHNSLYVSFYQNGLRQIKLTDWESATVESHTRLVSTPTNTYALGADNNLYYASGASLYMIPVNLTEEDWAEAEALDTRIADIGIVTLENAEEVKQIRADYETLSLRDKALVQNMNLLQEAESSLFEMKIDEATQCVSAQSVMTLGQLLNDYEDLTERQKKYVQNYDVLVAAYEQAVFLSMSEAANRVQEQILALSVTTRKDESAVVAAREAYEALSEEQKALVDAKPLIAAEEKLAQIKNTSILPLVYDFELYENPDFYTGCTKYSYDEGAGRIPTNFNASKIYNGSITIEKWFYNNYGTKINWGIETCVGAGTAADYSFRGASDQGMRMAAIAVEQYASLRLNVSAADTYTVDITAGNVGNTFDVYIIKATTGYASARTDAATITGAMTAENQLADNLVLKSEQTASLGNWTFPETGDYIVIFKAETNNNNGISLRNITMTPVVEVSEAEAIAKVNEAYFATLEDAFSYQAKTGADSVKLTWDIWEKDLVFPAGAVLDLNGYTLTADSVLTYGSNDLIDSSAEKTGLLKIQDADGNMLNENNSQLPLYDKTAGGYRFFEMKIEPVTVTGKENPKYWFRVTAEDFQKIYALKDSGLLVKVKLSWKGGEAEAVADAAFTQKWADAYNANQDIYLTVSAVNTEGLEDFVLTPCMTANGVTLAGEEM